MTTTMTTTMKKSPVLQDDQKFALMKVCILYRYVQCSIGSSERQCISNLDHFDRHNVVCTVRPPKTRNERYFKWYFVILFELDSVEVQFSHFFLAYAYEYVLPFTINGLVSSVYSYPSASALRIYK